MICTPLVEKIPRTLQFRDKRITIFTANIITIGRTFLAIPIVLSLRMQWCYTACFLIIFHDFLDHLDGIVAKVHKRVGYEDCPFLGSYLDAICDKVVNVTCLWSLLCLTDFSTLTFVQSLLLLTGSGALISSEIVLGIVRTQDYFHTKYSGNNKPRNLSASMEGKLKEKLESLGLAFLCVSHPMIFHSTIGPVGIGCIYLSVLLAMLSLNHKLSGRKESPSKSSPMENIKHQSEKYHHKVYTVGCFDLLHQGHINLFKEMRKYGKTVIVGVHSDESIQLLKNRWPIDPLEKRIANVKQYVDEVFVIPSTDPTPYVLAMVSVKEGETGIYIRGDDMPHFPGKFEVEKKMMVKFVPYTQGVSSTMLRKQLLEQRGATPPVSVN